MEGNWSTGGGLLFAALALVGWIRSLRAGSIFAGLFFALYWAVMVFWPEVTSGPRYALPLLPFMLYYAGETFAGLVAARRGLSPALSRGICAAAVAVVLFPASGSWFGDFRQARECRALAAEYGPWICWGRHYMAYHHALVWSTMYLPPESRVIARKPRLFYLYTGLRSNMFQYPSDRLQFIDHAAATQAGYYVHVSWDNLSLKYMEPLIVNNPDLFCRRAPLPVELSRDHDLCHPAAGTGKRRAARFSGDIAGRRPRLRTAGRSTAKPVATAINDNPASCTMKSVSGRGRTSSRKRGRHAPSDKSASFFKSEAVWGLVIVVVVHLGLAVAAAVPIAHTGGDNAAYLSLAHSLAQDGTYSELWNPGTPPHAKYPPLYPALLAALMLAGVKSWTAFKAVSLLFTSLSTAFCFLWLRKQCGTLAATSLSVLFGMGTTLLHYSRWVLSDPMFLALCLGFLWLLTPASRNQDGDLRLPSVQRVRARDLVGGLAMAAAAYFTRSAGLPLIAAALLWLALGRRWKPIGVFLCFFALPALLWAIRLDGSYSGEFWLINPYVSDLGQAALLDLILRAGMNLWVYIGVQIPRGMAGLEGTPAAVFGIILMALALVSWFRRLRAGFGVAEIFFALYSAMILLWPVAWSVDRFALPLFPILLLYASDTLQLLVGRLPRWPAKAVAAAAVLVVALPAGRSWTETTQQATSCRLGAMQGPLACRGDKVAGFHALALLSDQLLPPGATVFTRKPRLFYLFSGHPSVVYPFTTEEGRFFAAADSAGANYVLRTGWYNTELTYLDPVLRANPGRFCIVASLLLTSGEQLALYRIINEGSPCPESDYSLPSRESMTSMIVPILQR